ncbi:GntR family transcriptional regulator [Paenibacillus nasutitermitis]|uniref:GntR family transcriptional regulator n=1 Tax=Paenibacillus nasutitermitis TaxID=1652958 RepID=A0A916Z8A5_9BACL|nr:GntR family transcriptional regulator [Paenibacillus nasutitermitis]GGD80012.1 GntR family transcriptional regulator [Paenibacillus nasutitermitis]
MANVDDPLLRANHTREIVKRLRTDIILGKYKKGSRLIEAKIADQLGTSRAPVRTSFQLLAQEGLVLNLSNGGREVVGFSVKQVSDLFDLRLMLETKALELIILNSNFQYRPIFESMDQLKLHLETSANHEISSVDTSQADILFHRSLLLMSENNPLLVAWNTMANIFQTLLEITNMTSSTYREFYDDHQHLANLIIQRNPECLTELTAHISKAKKIIIQRLEDNIAKS